MNGFQFRLTLVAAFGFFGRVAYLVVLRNHVVTGDGTYYHSLAGLLADGKGFIEPRAFILRGATIASAPHPPLWSLVLALPARIGLRTLFEQQLVAAVVGTATIVVVGFAGRRLAGARAGLIAAAITAVVPAFVIYERELLAEPLAQLGIACVLLLAFRFQAHPSLGRALAVGVVCGLLALTRAEQVLLVVLLLVPLVLLAPDVAWRTRVGWVAAAIGVALVVIAPWSIYNTARFEDPVLLSTQLGPTMVESNCDLTYSGARLGYGDDRCRLASPANTASATDTDSTWDESSRDNAMRREAIDYVDAHKARALVVIAAREGRTFGLFRPFQQMRLDISRGTPRLPIDAGFVATWLLEIGAVVGVVVLRRRRVRLFPFMAVVATVAIGVAITFGATRYRAPADVALVLLAAVAVDAFWGRWGLQGGGSRADSSWSE